MLRCYCEEGAAQLHRKSNLHLSNIDDLFLHHSRDLRTRRSIELTALNSLTRIRLAVESSLEGMSSSDCGRS